MIWDDIIFIVCNAILKRQGWIVCLPCVTLPICQLFLFVTSKNNIYICCLTATALRRYLCIIHLSVQWSLCLSCTSIIYLQRLTCWWIQIQLSKDFGTKEIEKLKSRLTSWKFFGLKFDLIFISNYRSLLEQYWGWLFWSGSPCISSSLFQ